MGLPCNGPQKGPKYLNRTYLDYLEPQGKEYQHHVEVPVSSTQGAASFHGSPFKKSPTMWGSVVGPLMLGNSQRTTALLQQYSTYMQGAKTTMLKTTVEASRPIIEVEL